MKHPLAGQLKFFFNWRQWGTWGWVGPTPALPYAWRLILGPFAWARVTTESSTRMTRQRRRQLKREIAKAYRRSRNAHSG